MRRRLVGLLGLAGLGGYLVTKAVSGVRSTVTEARTSSGVPPVAEAASGTRRAGRVTVSVPLHLSGLERVFASASQVKGPLTAAVPQAVRLIQEQAGSALQVVGQPAVNATASDYGYLGTITLTVNYDPGRVDALTRIIRAVILANPTVRARVGGSDIGVVFA